MEKKIESLLTEEILHTFSRRFELGTEAKKLGDFENYVFEVYRDGEPFILRITHSSHRSREEIASELDWVIYLFEKGLAVPEVFRSIGGQLIEEMPANDGSVFFSCLFSKAQGEPVKSQSELFDVPLFRKWGETIGHMHQATKAYRPSPGIQPRDSWDKDDLMQIEKYFPANEQQLIENAQEVIESLRNLPRNTNNFGLIHSDIHLGNFFYDGEKINVFDFDDASYHWFVSDIAIPLYYSLLSIAPYEKEEERQRFGDVFLKAFIEGYETASQLPDGWDEQLPLMLKLRDVVLFAVLHKKIAPEDRNERVKSMLAEIGNRLMKKQPIYKYNKSSDTL